MRDTRVVLALAALAACGDNERPGTGAALVSLSLSPPSVQLDVGASQAFAVTGVYDDGSSGPVRDGLTWTSSDPDAVSIDAGLARALRPGAVTITAAAGAATGTAEVIASDPGLILFADAVADGVAFVPFDGSTTELTVDTSAPHGGGAALALAVPATGYAGGAFRTGAAADLSAYRAVTFWARASRATVLDVVGLGDDGAGNPRAAEWHAVPLTTTWARYVVPLPAPAQLTAETGLFHLAEGADGGAYTIWLDDLRYEAIDAAAVGAPAPAIASAQVAHVVGDAFPVEGASVTFPVGDSPRTLAVSRRYFTYASSDPDVATVDEAGVVHAVGVGAADITARLGELPATGTLGVTVAAATAPAEPAPAPTVPADDVIALFSDAYTAVAVDTWRADWSNATLTELEIGADHVKKYSNLVFAGIEFFRTAPVDATAMTHFHVDLWLPVLTALRLKLVDFGADGAYGGGDDREHELSFDDTTAPALAAGTWVGLDVPLEAFAGLTTRAHLSQLIVSSSSASTVYVDNVYLHRSSNAP